MWIHQRSDWPTFTWDSAVLSHKLAEIRYRQGWLLGRVESLGFDLRKSASLNTLTSDVVKSSAIEGKELNLADVRSSIAQKLGIDIGGVPLASRDVEGTVEMMLDATQQYSISLTAQRLFGWHAALFPTGWSGMHQITVGAWRPASVGAMQIVSGPIGREMVHFEAPNASRIDAEMEMFLSWFGNSQPTDPILKAGLAHLWFVTIHPFEDGNGRIARAIADMALARADNTGDRFYSMSSQIESERKMYYKKLEQQQRSTLDVTPWLDWFLDCLGRALVNAEDNLETILYKAKLWAYANQAPVNERQRLILNRMLDGFKGHMHTSKYAKLAKCSTDTALRDIQDFTARGVFVKNPGRGRSTSYRLATVEEIERG